MLEKQEKTKDAGKQTGDTKHRNAISLFVVMMLVIALALCSKQNTAQASTSNNTKIKNAWYTILSEEDELAQYQKPSSKTLKSVTIPDTVKIGSNTYKVSSIADNAFKNNKNIKKVTVGKNVTAIGKNAFYGCKNLKAITIKTTALTSGNVGSKAFKGLNAKAVVTVPSEKFYVYMELLKGRGLTGKNQCMARLMPSSTFNPSESQFEPEYCMFGIKSDGSQSSRYSVGDIVTLRSKVSFKSALYGHWEKDNRKLVKGYVQCGACMECFSDLMIAVHDALELYPGGCYSNYYIGNAGSNNPTTWVFVPDSDPCRTVFQYTLPQGLSYKEGSIKVTDTIDKDNLTKSCEVSVSGNCVTVIISDIKSSPFYYPYNYEDYKKDLYSGMWSDDEKTPSRRPIMVEISAEVTSDINKESVISSTTSYSYKGVQHAENYNATINTASLQISNTAADGNSLSGAEFDLYQMKTEYMEGSTLGTADWSLLASGIHAGDIISGLGTGDGYCENEYRVEQTKAPDGYKDAYPFDFELFIGEDGTVSAKDDDGNALEVRDGVVQVNVVNEARKSNSGNTTSSKNTDTVQDSPQRTDTSSSTNTPVTNTSASTGRKLVRVRVTYYKDGERESSMTYTQTVNAPETMMDKKEIRDRAYIFKECKLEKITLNGVEIDSLPEKVEDKSEVCYYYVTE